MHHPFTQIYDLAILNYFRAKKKTNLGVKFIQTGQVNHTWALLIIINLHPSQLV